MAATIQAADRTCRKCGETKPLDIFSRNGQCRGGRSHVCVSCDSARKRSAEARRRDPENAAAVNRGAGRGGAGRAA